MEKDEQTTGQRWPSGGRILWEAENGGGQQIGSSIGHSAQNAGGDRVAAGAGWPTARWHWRTWPGWLGEMAWNGLECRDSPIGKRNEYRAAASPGVCMSGRSISMLAALLAAGPRAEE